MAMVSDIHLHLPLGPELCTTANTLGKLTLCDFILDYIKYNFLLVPIWEITVLQHQKKKLQKTEIYYAVGADDDTVNVMQITIH